MNTVSIIKEHFESVLAPIVERLISADKYIVVIGGSVSYGFSDEYSDVDVYIIWDLNRKIWFDALRQHLFMHHVIENIKVQYIPLNLQDNQNAVLNGLLSGEMEDFNNGRISQLYDIIHYLPIHDTKLRINAAKKYVNSLNVAFWREKCNQHCCEHIDLLEAFYSSLKRNNTITGAMFFGSALKGLVEIAYLSESRPYPYAKWLWNGLGEIDKDLSGYLHNLLSYGLPRTCDEMRDSIYKVTEFIVIKLLKNEMVPNFITDSLLNP